MFIIYILEKKWQKFEKVNFINSINTCTIYGMSIQLCSAISGLPSSAPAPLRLRLRLRPLRMRTNAACATAHVHQLFYSWGFLSWAVYIQAPSIFQPYFCPKTVQRWPTTVMPLPKYPILMLQLALMQLIHLYHLIVFLSFLPRVFSSRKSGSASGQELLHLTGLRPPEVGPAQHSPALTRKQLQIHLRGFTFI